MRWLAPEEPFLIVLFPIWSEGGGYQGVGPCLFSVDLVAFIGAVPTFVGGGCESC